MAHQMAQEGALWPSSVMRLGPHCRNSKITWANIFRAVLDVGTYNTILNTIGVVKNTVAHP